MPTYIPEREHFRGYKMVDSKSEHQNRCNKPLRYSGTKLH